jgi:sugar phosphate permease
MKKFAISHHLTYRWVILGCCVLAYASSYLVRWSYTGLASYISEDLHLDKAALGLMGSVFFYPYALAQVPWGTLTDRIGGRHIISLGVLLSAGGLALFATSQGLGTAILWRMVVGVVAASAFVPIASLLAQWFQTPERGLANGIYYGLGGGLGEGAAFLLMPMIQLYLLHDSIFPFSGWRAATLLMAVFLALVGLLCYWLLQSYPRGPSTGQPLTAIGKSLPPIRASEEGSPTGFTSTLRDPVLWLLGGYFAAGVIALRLVPAWLVIFASDVSHYEWGYERDTAVMIGGLIGTFYAIGHIAGSPLVGRLSDGLLTIGINRMTLSTIGIGIGGVAIGLLTVPLSSAWMLGGIAVILGVSLHTFPVINAMVAERWGTHQTGRSLGWINMFGQLAGAVALSVSGFVGLGFSSDSYTPMSEYTGIWYLATACCAVGGICGWIASHLSNRQAI